MEEKQQKKKKSSWSPKTIGRRCEQVAFPLLMSSSLVLAKDSGTTIKDEMQQLSKRSPTSPLTRLTRRLWGRLIKHKGAGGASIVILRHPEPRRRALKDAALESCLKDESEKFN